jgi:hypothetical protein
VYLVLACNYREIPWITARITQITVILIPVG